MFKTITLIKKLQTIIKRFYQLIFFDLKKYSKKDTILRAKKVTMTFILKVHHASIKHKLNLYIFIFY